METRLDGGTLSVTIGGELDLYTAAEVADRIDRALDDKAVRRLDLDLGAVSFIDSSGLGVIFGRYKKMRHRGGQMQITRVSPVAHRVLQMAFVDRIIPVVGTAGPRARAGGEGSGHGG